MSVGYFSDDTINKGLYEVLESWVGTPYRHWSGVKNKGVDCIHFVVRVLEEVGACQGRVITIQKYSRDWHLHNERALLKEGIESMLPVVTIEDKKKVKDGDIILYKFGLQAAHAGIYHNGEVYQALDGSGVHHRQYCDPNFYERVKFIYRIVKL
jgi:cell wall-associated NlpC family hydrolase